jgi:hypothetical protein
MRKRREERAPSQQIGQYVKSLDGQTCQSGTVTALNVSTKGVLLVASDPFNKGEVLEVRFPKEKLTPTEVLEVCWCTGTGSGQYLLGCRRLVAVLSSHVEAYPLSA